jgi:hypothetical protein
MKKIIAYLPLILLLFNSCTDVLDKQPLDIISDKVVWTDPVLIDAYLNECYAEIGFYHEMPYGASQSWFDVDQATTIADEAKWGWTPNPQSHWISVGGGVYEWWGYATVRRLNQFIEKVGTSAIPESTKIQKISEARFLRAFAYFNMVKRYGGVPLITHTQKLTDSDSELYRSRDKEEVIYKFVLDEMDSIVNKLPEIYNGNDLGRPTKYAVLSLKSRAAMYAGSEATWGTVQLNGLVGIPQSKAVEYWTASYNASRSIITSTKFSLFNKYADKVKNYRNIFLEENNSEVIFSEIFDGVSGKGHSWDMWQNPYSYNVWAGGQQASVYLEMVESYDNTDGTSGVIDRSKIASGYWWTLDALWGKKDPRFKASIYTHGTPWAPAGILDYHDAIETPDGSKWLDVGSYNGVLCRSRSYGRSTPFGVLKYLDESKGIIPERFYSTTDYIVFRLGEIYLNYAEAAFELNKTGDALWAVNEIRKRAGMPELITITRDIIRHERKIELAFEGNRYFDVRRWKTAVTDLTKSFSGLRFILQGSSLVGSTYNVTNQKFKLYLVPDVTGIPMPYFVQMHYYLPISSGRTANNPNLIENPGYK